MIIDIIKNKDIICMMFILIETFILLINEDDEKLRKEKLIIPVVACISMISLWGGAISNILIERNIFNVSNLYYSINIAYLIIYIVNYINNKAVKRINFYVARVIIYFLYLNILQVI